MDAVGLTGRRIGFKAAVVVPEAESWSSLNATLRAFLDFGRRELSLPRISVDAKEAVRRVGIERCQSRIEAEPRPSVGTEDRVRLAHIDVDVRVVLRRRHADALELPHPDADFGDAAVVPEIRIAAAGHRLRPL